MSEAATFVENFYDSFTQAVMSEEDPAAVIDQYYVPGIVQIADGVELDREQLIAHLRPIRKNLVRWRYEVHEALRTGDNLAARFTIHAQLRKGDPITTDVYLFGELDPDGRMRRSTQLTRASSSPSSGGHV
ncbi:SnoaL-like protein [Kribbella orskensis]|uniref:SnoaL-like protein n=1 Tax=Kribbella orskensis TaxID=2512216 RepID=A0ABY2BJE3_9ACTN|nr:MULTISPECIES: nuclear transport factor 2 family protein [Kribbella]TCN39353.1 SnoaL-like protein [Kribbella sp. VKM Ac-2500]TCO22000.1 SnoaL-like protein [Kribbella orskensis]